MFRVLHVPLHLTYANKLASDAFNSVSSPLGGAMRVRDLLTLASWDFFDVLHLHTVELASIHDLRLLTQRLRADEKGLVFTLHDLMPNIESDIVEFDEKTRHMVRQASRVVTLTHAAARQALDRYAVMPSVIPHGMAVSQDQVAQGGGPRHGAGLLMFGALRPYRDVVAVAHAWRLLPAGRLPLRIVLRSVGPADTARYADQLTELTQIAATVPDLTVQITPTMLSRSDLLTMCRHASDLVLPYHRITHSGQLEFARDVGLRVLAPDVATLRAQLSETGSEEYPSTWFPIAALHNPAEFVPYLEKVSTMPPMQVVDAGDFARYRIAEHRQLLDQYHVEYRLSTGRGSTE